MLSVRTLSAWLRRSTAVLVPALLLAPACGSRARHPGQVPSSPQAALEAQLLGRRNKLNKRSSDGAVLYTAELLTSSGENVRVPYDLLKLECESHGGTFGPIAPPEKSAASLAEPTDAPDAVVDSLRDADGRGLFGQHRCQLGADAWLAQIEPVSVSPGKRGAVRLQLYVRADPEEGYTPGAPLGPGLPPLAAARAAQPSASGGALPPPAAGDATPPPAAARAPVSPLDQQPPRPSASGERLLADPKPFRVDPGVDAPEILAKKLGLDLAQATRCDEAGLTAYCWEHPGSEALAARAAFADLGSGPVLAELGVRYPARSYGWLSHMFTNLYGPSDSASDAQTSWSWLHTSIELTQSGDEARVNVAHKPSLDRARLPAGSPGREQPIAGRIATPWQLQLGYEPAQQAQQKLQVAGFSIAQTGCDDGGAHARPVLTRTCPLQGGKMEGLKGAWVRIVDIGDGRPRLAELGYHLEARVRDTTLRDLKDQYGDPIPSDGNSQQWWTGSIGITLTPSADGFSLRYYHGRLLQIFIAADVKRRSADAGMQRQGL